MTRALRTTAFYSEITLLIAGTLFFSAAGFRFATFAAFQRYYDFVFDGQNTTSKVAGRLTAPRVGLSVVVVNGDDADSLNLGAGVMPGTAAIGANGNTVIAGHRDTAFRALRELKLGDEIQIQARKAYTYRVKQIRIVSPEDVSVLRDDGVPKLTMITCYPFNFIGDAPKRYVVEAERLP